MDLSCLKNQLQINCRTSEEVLWQECLVRPSHWVDQDCIGVSQRQQWRKNKRNGSCNLVDEIGGDWIQCYLVDCWNHKVCSVRPLPLLPQTVDFWNFLPSIFYWDVYLGLRTQILLQTVKRQIKTLLMKLFQVLSILVHLNSTLVISSQQCRESEVKLRCWNEISFTVCNLVLSSKFLYSSKHRDAVDKGTESTEDLNSSKQRSVHVFNNAQAKNDT